MRRLMRHNNKQEKLSNKTIERLNKIANYWERKDTISLLDRNLKILEITVIKDTLRKNDVAIDIGCGDGKSACECAKYVKEMTGIDNSMNMIKKAKRFSAGRYPSITFKKWNILNLREFDKKFSVAITDRTITNLPSWELQKNAILDIKSILKKGGRYIMIENFIEGYDNMVKFRKAMGLEKIPIHWHNKYLEKRKLVPFLRNHFNVVKEYNFNLYYFLTRIYTPMFASYTGWGKNSKKDPIFTYSDRTAREITKKLSTRIKFLENDFFGPINGLLLVKK